MSHQMRTSYEYCPFLYPLFQFSSVPYILGSQCVRPSHHEAVIKMEQDPNLRRLLTHDGEEGGRPGEQGEDPYVFQVRSRI